MSLSPLIRLAPLQIGDLPAHPSFEPDPSDGGGSNTRPELSTFVTSLLDQGLAFVHPTSFNLAFKSHSWKSSPPSNNDVEVLSHTVPPAQLSRVDWGSTPGVARSKPRPAKEPEYWYARRSTHQNVSVKLNPATANWAEFVYGLRDQHSRHEADFTPTIYDARPACDWAEQLRAPDGDGTLRARGYGNVTLAVVEMCHKVPAPMSPRVFPVVVATADVLSDGRNGRCFVAVTVPVNLSSCPAAFYSNGRHRREGAGALARKEVVLGSYVAVEKVERYVKKDPRTSNNAGPADGEEVEWLMATASDARGNAPTLLQRMSMPGAIVKDVGLFLKWIRKVPEQDVRGQPAAALGASD